MVYSGLQSPVLTHFKTTVQWTAQRCQFSSSLGRNRALATGQVPLQCSNIQINLSHVFRLPPSSEWPTSSHPSVPPLSSGTNISTRHWDILWLFCADLIMDKDGEHRRGKLITCAKWVRILALDIQQPVLLNVPSKSVIQPEKNSRSYHMRWLKSKANTHTSVYTKTDDYRTQGLARTT